LKGSVHKPYNIRFVVLRKPAVLFTHIGHLLTLQPL